MLEEQSPDSFVLIAILNHKGYFRSMIDGQAIISPDADNLFMPASDHFRNQTKIIVVTNTNSASETNQAGALMEVGILADDVADVVSIFKEDIEPSLTTHTGARAEHLQGVTADMLVVLNLHTLLSDKRLIVHEEIM